MDVLLARILKYLNGALRYDDDYKFCTYIIDNYLELAGTELPDEEEEIKKISDQMLAVLLEKTGINEENLQDFVRRLGNEDWNAFVKLLCRHHLTRLDQIGQRMIGMNPAEFVKDMPKQMSDEEMLNYIKSICEEIDKAERIILVGALYPMSIAVEFQTDLIAFGKNVIQYHSYDKTLHFSDKDFIIFISATGRAMEGFLKAKANLNVEDAVSLLITQSPKYTMDRFKVSTYTLRPGRFNDIEFNYQIMKIFDLLRITYYYQYYIGEEVSAE